MVVGTMDYNFLNQLAAQAVGLGSQEALQHCNSILLKPDDCLRCCYTLLNSPPQPPYYDIVLASKWLERLTFDRTTMGVNERLDLSCFLLRYAMEHGPALSKYALALLCPIYALVTKLNWMEGDEEKNIFPFRLPLVQLIPMAENPDAKGLISLRLLTDLVKEASDDRGFETISRMRRMSSDLRDTFLLPIFEMAVKVVKSTAASVKAAPPLGGGGLLPTTSSADAINEAYFVRMEQALDLVLACLSYDFSGAQVDEAADNDAINVQIPSKWNPMFSSEQQLVATFFGLYSKPLPEELVDKALQIVAQLAAVRRMLFDPTERQNYLGEMVSGMKAVLEREEKLAVPAILHNFCRIGSRLKANYQIAEFQKCNDFLSLLQLLTNFTGRLASQITGESQNSVYYLISFWSKMVGSMSYARQNVDEINRCVPIVVEAFIRSRMEISDLVVRDNIDDPLDNAGNLHQFMELFTVVARRSYSVSARLLNDQFDASYASAATSLDPQQKQMAVKRLVWVVTLTAACLTGRMFPSGGGDNEQEENEGLDGGLSAKVFRLMDITDQGANNLGLDFGSAHLQLERAYLYFVEEFNRAYLTDRLNGDGACFVVLNKEMDLGTEVKIVQRYAKKIITNLRLWGARSEELLGSTLKLLTELTNNYNNVRRLMLSEEMKQLLLQHNQFEFTQAPNPHKLPNNRWRIVVRSRTSYYCCLMKLILTQLDDSYDPFYRFMEPITEIFQFFITRIFDVDPGTGKAVLKPEYAIRNEEVKWAMAGLCRDLRGIASAITTQRPVYQQLLLAEWFGLSLTTFSQGGSPIFGCLRRSAELWAHDAEVMSPLLRLLVELVHNSHNRLMFEVSSPGPILLFREVSNIMLAYGNKLLALPDLPEDRVYKERIKGVALMAKFTKYSLEGGYLPFGVFPIYGDESLNNLLSITFQLFARCNKQVNLIVYKKATLSLCQWLDWVTRQLTDSFVAVKLPTEVLAEVLRFIRRVINDSLDPIAVSSACTSLEYLLDDLLELAEHMKEVEKRQTVPWLQTTAPDGSPTSSRRSPDNSNLLRTIREESIHRELYELTTTMLRQYVRDEVKCQWSMTRPLLPLIIIYPNARQEWRNDLLAQMPTVEQQQQLEAAFVRLYEGLQLDPSAFNGGGGGGKRGGGDVMGNTMWGRNKENFQQQLVVFRRDLEATVKGELLPAVMGGGEDGGGEGVVGGFRGVGGAGGGGGSEGYDYADGSQLMAE